MTKSKKKDERLSAACNIDAEEAKKLFSENGVEVFDVQEVPYYSCGVKAGRPAEPGDFMDETIMVPRSSGVEMQYCVRVDGKSMQDCGIENNDILTISQTERIYEGDVVVANVDGGMTVKAWYVDRRGNAWLIPQNDNVDPIPLHPGSNTVYIIGKVTSVLKASPHINTRECNRVLEHHGFFDTDDKLCDLDDPDTPLHLLKEEKQTDDDEPLHLLEHKEEKKKKKPEKPSKERVLQGIRRVSHDVTSSRMWFSIYRILVDVGYLVENDYEGLKALVDEAEPEHPKKVNTTDLPRMSVLSFRFPLDQWRGNNAPVQGKVYLNYYLLAERFMHYLCTGK